jgi:hypothetical protein
MATQSVDVIRRLDIKDDQLFRLGDVIDVKASIGLVVITFLATQTAEFLKDKSLPGLHYLHFLAAVSVAVAGLLALIELWPRDYELEGSEGLAEWKDELSAYYKNDPDGAAKAAVAFTEGQVTRTVERIRNNAAINNRKSQFLIWSFRFAGLAFALNVLALIVRAAG